MTDYTRNKGEKLTEVSEELKDILTDIHNARILIPSADRIVKALRTQNIKISKQRIAQLAENKRSFISVYKGKGGGKREQK